MGTETPKKAKTMKSGNPVLETIWALKCSRFLCYFLKVLFGEFGRHKDGEGRQRGGKVNQKASSKWSENDGFTIVKQ